MSDDASTTSGRSPTAGSVGHWVPAMVSFVVAWTWAVVGETGETWISAAVGSRRKPTASVVAATRTDPTRPGDPVVRRPIHGEQVHRDHEELQRGASLQEQDAVVVRDAGQGADVGLGRRQDP